MLSVGLHPDVSEADYHKDPVEGGSLSSTGARTLVNRTPAHFAHEAVFGRKPKAEFDLGSAFHVSVLGAGAELEVLDFDVFTTKAAREARDEAYDAGKTPLTRPQARQVERMVSAVRAHPVAGKLFARTDCRPEVTFIGRDPETGVLCRARTDWLLPIRDGQPIRYVDLKGLALDTPLPTPTGWTTMRDVQVGDVLFGSDGKPCTVTAKSDVHYRRCYRMTFDDTSSVICDAEHRWVTTTGIRDKSRRNGGISTSDHTAEEVRATLRSDHGTRQHRVATAAPLEIERGPSLPIDPYVLGAWLGDGSASAGRITKPDEELFANIAARGYDVGPATITNDGRCGTRTVYGLRTHLRLAGLLGMKHIPDVYLRASYGERLDLLRGLFDTDGYWNRPRKRAQFTSTDKAIAEQVRELVMSLGQRATLTQNQAHGYGKTVTAYNVCFRPTDGLVPFALPRKAELVNPGKTSTRAKFRIVSSVDEVPTVPTQCITVDSADHTYLCTEWMIPTHNSGQDASPRGMAKSMSDFGYPSQFDFYNDVIRWALGLPDDYPVIGTLVATEKEPPHLVGMGQPDEQALAWAHEDNRRARHIYARCTESGQWPGYGDAIVPLSLPGWRLAAYESQYPNGLFEPDDFFEDYS